MPFFKAFAIVNCACRHASDHLCERMYDSLLAYDASGAENRATADLGRISEEHTDLLKTTIYIFIFALKYYNLFIKSEI